MEIHILLGIYGLDDESHFQDFLTKLAEGGVKISSCERRYKKSGINDCLEKNPAIDTLILSEFLESAYPYSIKEFEHILEKNESLNIIPIMVNERKNKEYAALLFQLGIYNGLFENDAYADNIAKLLLKGRSRKKAKDYYGVKELEKGSNFDIESCICYIENAKESDEIICNAKYVREKITYQEFLKVLSALSEESRKAIRQEEEFKLFFLDGFEQKKESNIGNKLPVINTRHMIQSVKNLFGQALSQANSKKENIVEEGFLERGKAPVTKKDRNKTDVIFISSLKHGTGNTFFGVSIANFLSTQGKVCFIHHGSKETEYLLYDKVTFSMQKGEYHNLYEQRGYLVFDCGTEHELSKDLIEERARASVKILMCFSDEEYLKRLADFVERLGDKVEEWIFIFNLEFYSSKNGNPL